MPYIDFGNAYAGIRGALAFRPAVAEPLGMLTDVLMRGESGLTRAERELIGMHVSALNNCDYCFRSHAAIACIYLGNNEELVKSIHQNFQDANISPKLKALLALAGKVQISGKAVSEQDIAEAKNAGATDVDIHDTVLIAALFCLFNRYVDGLSAITPADEESYKNRAKQVVENGYTGVTNSLK